MRPFTGTVAITGLNATDNPGPGLAVARSLRGDPAFQGRIVGLAYDVLDPALYVDGLLDAAFLIPYPSVGRDALLDRLAWIRARVGLDVLLPNLDSELPALVGMEPVLEAMGIHTLLPSPAAHAARAKARLDGLREDHGIPVPRSVTLTDPAGLDAAIAELGTPIVVKGVFYGARICTTAAAAHTAFHEAAAKWGLPIICQAYHHGEERNVCAVGDGEGGLVGAVASRKTLITDSGKGWCGVSIHDAGLMKLTEDLVAALRWRGPLEVEALRDDAGQLWLLEVNPRFPAWCDLTAGAGQNLPLATVRMAMGEKVPPMTSYAAGKAFIRVSINQIVDIQALEALAVTGASIPATDGDAVTRRSA